MKLLLCRQCWDIVRLYEAWRPCQCGKSRGRYIDDTHVALDGPSAAIGIDTGEVKTASGGSWHLSDRTVRLNH